MTESASTAESLFDQLRAACAEVARRARFVRIDDEALESFAAHLASERPRPPDLDPGRRWLVGPDTTLAFVITLDAVNFGSGWFPHLRKPDGLSGYRTIAGRLRERFRRDGPWSASALRRLTARDCADVFGQSLEPPIEELMELFARSLNDLGRFLESRYRGRFAGPVEEAAHSAERLVGILARMPLYRDVARYQDLVVPFYKRAQITCADLSETFRGRGLGRFADLESLTLFADNLVPHVLRMLGILVYEPGLSLRVDREELLESGCEEEVEIRAVALWAVEHLSGACRRRGFAATPRRLDGLLWTRGQHPRIKARPRHRTRCAYY